MRLNQRKNINEQGTNEKELRSNVFQRYKNHIEHVIQDSEVSFNSIETPGWTSLFNTQQSKLMNSHNKKKLPPQDTHIQILTRLNSLPKLNSKSSSYNNIKVHPSSVKNKNVIVYGSVKLQEKRINQTPRSRLSNKESIGSKKSEKEKNILPIKNNQNSTQSNKIISRFNSNKPTIFFSVERPSNQSCKTERKRVQSERSQPSENLKQKIQQRLSMGNYRKIQPNQDFERNICTQPNQEIQTQRNNQHKNKFYSLNTQTNVLKSSKNQYFNRYMKKLNLRNKNQASVKIFKKQNSNEVTNKQNKNTLKTDLIKEKQNKSKRFNSITVHDHLYHDFVKFESKKKVQKMIDDSYNKATTFTFTPFISEKSILLADSKFERESNEGKKQQNQRHNFTECCKKTSKKLSKPLKESIYTVRQQISMKQKQRMSEILHTRTLSRLFAFLSNSTQQINEKTIESNVQKFPLSLLQLIEPFLTQVYRKKRFSQNEFLGLFFSTSISQSQEQKFLNSRRIVIIRQTQKFFKHLEMKKDNSQSAKLKRKHNLLRAIVRTNQNDNLIEGVSDYDQSFKRLYDNFKSIYAKPILEARNFVIDDGFNEIPLTPNIPMIQKPATSISNKKRIEYQNCLNWARKHKKKGEFYEQQLGKHLKEKKEQNINQGHSMMPQVQRKLKYLSQSFKTE